MSATPEHAMRVLGLYSDVTLEKVHIRRRSLAKKYHPDRAADPVRATCHMARINAAADTLTRHLKNKPMPRSQQVKVRKCTVPATSNDKPAPDLASPPTAPEPIKTIHPSEKANLTLIRVASQSYNNAINTLGTISRAPTVDVRALD